MKRTTGAAASRGSAWSTAKTVQPASGTKKKSAIAIAVAEKREAQRKQLFEMRRKNKIAMAAAVNTTDDNNMIGDDETPADD